MGRRARFWRVKRNLLEVLRDEQLALALNYAVLCYGSAMILAYAGGICQKRMRSVASSFKVEFQRELLLRGWNKVEFFRWIPPFVSARICFNSCMSHNHGQSAKAHKGSDCTSGVEAQ